MLLGLPKAFFYGIIIRALSFTEPLWLSLAVRGRRILHGLVGLALDGCGGFVDRLSDDSRIER